jgi:hypothetical protein
MASPNWPARSALSAVRSVMVHSDLRWAGSVTSTTLFT